jgi:hypothetical protein
MPIGHEAQREGRDASVAPIADATAQGKKPTGTQGVGAAAQPARWPAVWRTLRRHQVSIVVVVVGLLAMAALASLFATRDSSDRNELWLEVGKALVTLLTVGVLGTLLKQLADAYQAKRRRQEQRAEFRLEKYQRLVQTTNKLRRIPLLVPADPSLEALRGHLLEVLDVGAELRVIKHEIYASRKVQDAPFKDTEAVTRTLEQMYAYADAMASEFEAALSAAGRGIGEAPALADLYQRPRAADLLRSAGRDERDRTPSSWDEYLALETEVLERMTAATLGDRAGAAPSAGSDALP